MRSHIDVKRCKERNRRHHKRNIPIEKQIFDVEIGAIDAIQIWSVLRKDIIANNI